MSDHENDRAKTEDGEEHEGAGRARRSTPPGKSTLTSRLGASPSAIARAVVAQLKEESAPSVQARGAGGDGADVHAAAAHGTSDGGGRLPFLDEIQRAFGHHDVTGVRAHVGGPAADASAALGAQAYAFGDDVAFAAQPDLHLAAHEAAHVVQQRAGVRLAGGVGRAGDEYERHADAVADGVVRGDFVQDLLGDLAHRGPAGGPAVQRSEPPRITTSLDAQTRALAIVRRLDLPGLARAQAAIVQARRAPVMQERVVVELGGESLPLRRDQLDAIASAVERRGADLRVGRQGPSTEGLSPRDAATVRELGARYGAGPGSAAELDTDFAALCALATRPELAPDVAATLRRIASAMQRAAERLAQVRDAQRPTAAVGPATRPEGSPADHLGTLDQIRGGPLAALSVAIARLQGHGPDVMARRAQAAAAADAQLQAIGTTGESMSRATMPVRTEGAGPTVIGVDGTDAPTGGRYRGPE